MFVPLLRRRAVPRDRSCPRAALRVRRASLAAAVALVAPLTLVSPRAARGAPLAVDVAPSSSASAVRVEGLPPPTEMPALLTLARAMELFRTQGLDLLIADAATKSAEAAVTIGAAVPNPTVSVGVNDSFTFADTNYGRQSCYAAGAACSPWAYSVSVSDGFAIEDTVSGKRDLRIRVARAALAAAKLSRVDVERTVGAQVKTAYATVAQASLAHAFAATVAASNVVTLKKFRERLAAGAITEGDVRRIETQKLEADQAVDTAMVTLRQARAALAILLGVRGWVPTFDVETTVLDFAVPAQLGGATEPSLLKVALVSRPDLLAQTYTKMSADAQIALSERLRVPDVGLSLTYAWGGYGGTSTNSPIQGTMLGVGVSFSLPVAYQFDGEIKAAHAVRDAASAQEAKLTAQVVSDVDTAFAAYVGARKLVERMEGPRRDDGGLLDSAKGAFEILAAQYDRGASGVSLTDYLDAWRTYVATKAESIGDLASYWGAVFQLEAAVGKDLR
jgi:cobalt-zinc-cadmium efflux system outer membrane protein